MYMNCIAIKTTLVKAYTNFISKTMRNDLQMSIILSRKLHMQSIKHFITYTDLHLSKKKQPGIEQVPHIINIKANNYNNYSPGTITAILNRATPLRDPAIKARLTHKEYLQ